jgi:hypothetical protein
MQIAWEERNLAEKAALTAARSFVDAEADEIAAVDHNYDDKVDAMNAAVDTMIAASLSFADATRALVETEATRLPCLRFEAAARALCDERERHYPSRTARRKVGDNQLKNADAEFESAYADVVASIRCELGLTLN